MVPAQVLVQQATKVCDWGNFLPPRWSAEVCMQLLAGSSDPCVQSPQLKQQQNQQQQQQRGMLQLMISSVW
jgi:hypothetical protein